MRPHHPIISRSAALLLLSGATISCADQTPTAARAARPEGAPSRLASLSIPSQPLVRTMATGSFGSTAVRYVDGHPVSWGALWYAAPYGVDGIVSVSAGPNYALGLRNDGTVAKWGASGTSALNVPAGLNNVVAISASEFHAMALRSDGSVWAWGTDPFGAMVPPLGTPPLVAISAGGKQSLGLKGDGTVVSWGQTPLPSGLTDVVAIASGYDHALALHADGTVSAWGNDSSGKATVPPGLTDVVAIAAGYLHSLALKSDGTVVAWGDDFYGETDVPPGLSDVVAIAASGGSLHSLAMKSDGTIVPWGNAGGAIPTGLVPRVPGASPATAVIAAAMNDTVRAVEGTMRRLSTYGSTDGSIGRVSYTWTLDGTQVAAADRWIQNTLSFDTTFADQGTHTVSLHMTDAVGGNSTANATLVVANAAPVVAWTQEPVFKGKTLTLCPTFSDAGAQDSPWSYAVLWGDGISATGSTSTQGNLGCFIHTYTGDPGRTYGARVRVTDKDGGSRVLGWTVVMP
jgi:hypothetical protein